MNSPFTPVKVAQSSLILLNILSQKKEMDFKDLQLASNLDDMCFFMAIGYMLNEGTAIFVERENNYIIKILKL
jgi:hypothetical protein